MRFEKKKCHSQPPAAWKGLAPPSQSAQNPRKRWSLEVEKKGKIPRNLTGSTRKADGLDVSLQFLEHNMFIPIWSKQSWWLVDPIGTEQNALVATYNNLVFRNRRFLGISQFHIGIWIGFFSGLLLCLKFLRFKTLPALLPTKMMVASGKAPAMSPSYLNSIQFFGPTGSFSMWYPLVI